jgi:RTX calcium-binding nonapeptide repeat (4 copies)
MRVAIAVGTAVLVGLVAVPGASTQTPGVSCELRPDRTLRIVHRSETFPPTIKRDGERIAVTDDVGDEYACSGGTPTVRSVDTISYASRARIDGLTIDIGEGRLGPGATDEGDGSSEIEVEARLGSDDPVLAIYGSGRRESVTLGLGAVNLDSSERRDDADVLFQAIHERLEFQLGGSRDFFSTAVSDGFDGSYRGEVTAVGGSGRDRLVGGATDQVLVGDTGRDTMIGGPGPDMLFGDEYGPEPEFEQLIAQDSMRCGGGEDEAFVDPRDRARQCERVHVRRPD